LYVESTTAPYLSNRLAEHRYASKRGVKMPLYDKTRSRPDSWNGLHLELVENYPCQSIDELFTRERYWIETLKPSLNVQLPITTQAEKKQKRAQLDKALYAKKHNELLQSNKKYYQEH
jgi:hypothetical protein